MNNSIFKIAIFLLTGLMCITFTPKGYSMVRETPFAHYEREAAHILADLDQFLPPHGERANGSHNGVNGMKKSYLEVLCNRGFALLEEGRTNALQYTEALNCFKQIVAMPSQAAMELVARAYFGLAVLYYFKVPRVAALQTIYNYFSFAAENTNDLKVRAQSWFYLGDFHYFAHIGKTDYQKAAKFYCLAAAQRDDYDAAFHALVRLAVMYAFGGYGIEKNFELALYYRNLAYALKEQRA